MLFPSIIWRDTSESRIEIAFDLSLLSERMLKIILLFASDISVHFIVSFCGDLIVTDRSSLNLYGSLLPMLISKDSLDSLPKFSEVEGYH